VVLRVDSTEEEWGGGGQAVVLTSEPRWQY
jgi:hypothetical protein